MNSLQVEPSITAIRTAMTVAELRSKLLESLPGELVYIRLPCGGDAAVVGVRRWCVVEGETCRRETRLTIEPH